MHGNHQISGGIMLTKKAWVAFLLLSLGGAHLAGAADAPEKKNVLAAVDATIYGYVRGDAAFDTSRVFPGNYYLSVKPETTYNDDNQFNLTANQTRLGLNLTGPDFPGIKTDGKVEFDFYGGGPENKSNVMLRQAYLQWQWADCGIGLLAGQTWDVVSPLYVDTLNYVAGGGEGDMGYRRPQVRLTKGFAVTEKGKVVAKLAAMRTLGRADVISGTETGSDAGKPTGQGSVAFEGPLWTTKPALLGVSGLYGYEEYDLNAGNDHKELNSWAVSLDVSLPLMENAMLKASVWKGANLETYLGGVGQGVNTVSLESVPVRGGWVTLGVNPWADWKFTAGATIEQTDPNDIPDVTPAANSWHYQNSSIFLNGTYNVTTNTQLALEVGQLRTLFKQVNPGDALRVQLAFIFNFI
jgi:hypothetical protein